MAMIYALECAVNGFAYVGFTANPSKRFREHRSLLNNALHSATRMIPDWKQYGESAFVMKVLELLPDDASVLVKREAELRWQNDYADRGRLYNRAICSFAGTPASIMLAIEASRTSVGNRWTPEANMKRRLAQLGKPKGHGAKISATKRAKRLRDEIVCSAGK